VSQLVPEKRNSSEEREQTQHPKVLKIDSIKGRKT
jgi:hypothetical protein